MDINNSFCPSTSWTSLFFCLSMVTSCITISRHWLVTGSARTGSTRRSFLGTQLKSKTYRSAPELSRVSYFCILPVFLDICCFNMHTCGYTHTYLLYISYNMNIIQQSMPPGVHENPAGENPQWSHPSSPGPVISESHCSTTPDPRGPRRMVATTNWEGRIGSLVWLADHLLVVSSLCKKSLDYGTN